MLDELAVLLLKRELPLGLLPPIGEQRREAVGRVDVLLLAVDAPPGVDACFLGFVGLEEAVLPFLYEKCQGREG